MANFSNYAESGILNYLFRSNTNTFAAPATVAVALCSNVPSESHDGDTIPEIANAGSYARVDLGAPANSDWTEVAQVSESGGISNAADITFPTATADWGYVSGVAIVTSATHGQGRMLLWGALTTPRVVLNGDTFKFTAGQMNIYLG